MKVYNSTHSNRSWNLKAMAITAGFSIACPCLSDVFNGQQFLPDYLYPDSHMNHQDVVGSGETMHFSAYGYTNEDLDQAAANFGDNRLNTTQRLLNHQWLSQQHHNAEYKKGTKIFSKLFKAGAKAYWQQLRANKLIKTSALPDGNGEGQLSEVRYRMRLNDDSLRVSVSYEF